VKSKLLAIGSVLFPICFLFIYVTFNIMGLFVNMEPPLVNVVIILLYLSIGGIWFFIIYYTVQAAQSQSFSRAAKAGWICALWFLSVFAIPVYWFRFVRQQHQKHPTTGST